MSHPPLDRLVRKLGSRGELTSTDRQSILDLPHATRTYNATAYVVREGEPPREFCTFLERGYAFRQKITADGERQIVSLHLPGDFIDLQNLFLNISDHSVQALTEAGVVEVNRSALQELALARPNVGRALWVDALIDASIYREWIMNLGRRSARVRMAHLLCEFGLRLKEAGLSSEAGFELPMTQEQLADALGLTSVHVNRTLKSLEADGVVVRKKRYVSFESWDRIKAVGDFNALYLHLDQANPMQQNSAPTVKT